MKPKSRLPFTLQSVNDHLDTVWNIKKNNSDLLEIMSPSHKIAQEVVSRSWDFLHDYIPDDPGKSKPFIEKPLPNLGFVREQSYPQVELSSSPFEDIDTVSTIMHKLSSAHSQLYSIEHKLQSYAMKHKATELKAEPSYGQSMVEVFHFVGREGYPQVTHLPDTCYEKGRKRWERLEAEAAAGLPPSALDPLEPLRVIKKRSIALIEMIHPYHLSTDYTLTLAWKELQAQLSKHRPTTLEELNTVSSTIHKLMCTYTQLITTEIKILERILSQDYYKPTKPDVGPPPPCTPRAIMQLEEELGIPNEIQEKLGISNYKGPHDTPLPFLQPPPSPLLRKMSDEIPKEVSPELYNVGTSIITQRTKTDPSPPHALPLIKVQDWQKH